MKSYSLTIQMKPLRQYFCLVPFVFQYFTFGTLGRNARDKIFVLLDLYCNKWFNLCLQSHWNKDEWLLSSSDSDHQRWTIVIWLEELEFGILENWWLNRSGRLWEVTRGTWRFICNKIQYHERENTTAAIYLWIQVQQAEPGPRYLDCTTGCLLVTHAVASWHESSVGCTHWQVMS